MLNVSYSPQLQETAKRPRITPNLFHRFSAIIVGPLFTNILRHSLGASK